MSDAQTRFFNSVELGLFSSRIAAICEEMGALLGRVAFSPNIRDRLDYSCALFNRQGHLLGQATHIPVHLGSMAYAMVDLVESRDWHAGDMLILNDPFKGGGRVLCQPGPPCRYWLGCTRFHAGQPGAGRGRHTHTADPADAKRQRG
jgi:hypothetical protein